MRVKVRLDTLTDIRQFVDIVGKVAGKTNVYLTDGQHFTVSAKSVLGAAYTMEWCEVYCTCEKDIYRHIEQFVEL